MMTTHAEIYLPAILSLTKASSAEMLDFIEEPLNALGGSAAIPATTSVPLTNSLLFITPSFLGCFSRKDRKE